MFWGGLYSNELTISSLLNNALNEALGTRGPMSVTAGAVSDTPVWVPGLAGCDVCIAIFLPGTTCSISAIGLVSGGPRFGLMRIISLRPTFAGTEFGAWSLKPDSA